jgi:uncharacterized protein (TIGR00730 family)
MSPVLNPNNALPISQFLAIDEFAHSAQQGNSYRFAFDDQDFMTRPETRGIRFQLELLKPDLILKEHGIDNTIVVFGSARSVSPEQLAQKAETELASVEGLSANMLANVAINEHTSQATEGMIPGRAVDAASVANYQSAREFGRLVAKFNLSQGMNSRKLRICTGGGPGIMEAATRGAHEAGDLTVGFNISLPKEQSPNPYITPELCFRFHYFALRKMHFLMRARAIVAYPGGFGSFDELFEVLTLMQTKKISAFPVVLVNQRFWRSIVNFDVFVEQGLIDEADMALIHFVDTAEQAWQVIYDWYELAYPQDKLY